MVLEDRVSHSGGHWSGYPSDLTHKKGKVDEYFEMLSLKKYTLHKPPIADLNWMVELLE